MLFIRTAKSMVFVTTAIATVILILALSMTRTEVIAGEHLPDSEMATLFGGWWFTNPECRLSGDECLGHTPCQDPTDNCCVCTFITGYYCFNVQSHVPDLDGCDDGNKSCPSGCVKGYCAADLSCNMGDLGGEFPDCNDDTYDWCDD